MIMKALILYFSLSGRTKTVAESIAAQLGKFSVDLESITYTGKPRDFIIADNESIHSGKWDSLRANEKIFDVSGYDIICIGMPVYGGQPAVVFHAYIKKCTGISGKKVYLFTTCRLFAGKTMTIMREEVEKLGGIIPDTLVCKAMFRIGKKLPVVFGQKINSTVN